MNFYKYQRSRSFTDLHPRSLRFSCFKIFSKTAGLIKSKLHIVPQWGWKISLFMESGSHDQGDCHDENDLIFFISGTERLMTETWYTALGTLALPGLFK